MAEKRSILLVDDECLLSCALGDLLRKNGYQTETAGDGLLALHMLESFMPDVVITDINMPKMDGISLIKALRDSDKESLRTIKIIAISGINQEEKVLEAGADAFILKPVALGQLVNLIEENAPTQHEL